MARIYQRRQELRSDWQSADPAREETMRLHRSRIMPWKGEQCLTFNKGTKGLPEITLATR
ncbi:hypothetical protein BDR22DRAFT_866389 [Usnea florida]